MKKFDIAVVGCTGKVGRQMITVLEERKLPYNNVVMFASAKSAGSTKITASALGGKLQTSCAITVSTPLTTSAAAKSSAVFSF